METPLKKRLNIDRNPDLKVIGNPLKKERRQGEESLTKTLKRDGNPFKKKVKHR